MNHELTVTGGGIARVLVVEDNALLARVIDAGLRPHAAVTVCCSGNDALAAIHDHTFDAVTVDIGLPDMSGLEVISRARAALPEAGILAITGAIEVSVAVSAMKAGADDFIGKPFQPDFLWHSLMKARTARRRQIDADRAEAYRTLAYTDALTGCPNRRLVDEYLAQAIERSAPGCEPLTVAYLDVDNFKLLNDVVGHDQGDAVLRRVAELLETIVIAPAVFGRSEATSSWPSSRGQPNRAYNSCWNGSRRGLPPTTAWPRSGRPFPSGSA